MIERPENVSKLIAYKDTDFIKVITGVRRCGKSTLLKLFANHLTRHGVGQDRIITINYESLLSSDLRDPKLLHEYVGEKVEAANGEPLYVFIDEAQEIEQWAYVMNSLKATFPVDLYVTGSNSKLFAGEDLTYITGRYIELRMYPLSFKEFVAFRGLRSDDECSSQNTPPVSYEKALNDYLSQGSFPAVALSPNQELVQAITQGLIDSIVMRDVVQRGRIDNDASFQRVAQFVFGAVGSEISANKIANTLKSAGYSVTANTVDRYLNLLCDAFVLYKCQRYDIRGKERLRFNGKYYVVDTGLRNAFLGERPRDFGHVLENVVYMELLRRDYEVTVGRIGAKEIDFVAVNGTEKVYVQVASTLVEVAVQEREFSALLAVRDAYPKYVVSMDEIDYSRDGIRHLNIVPFLLGAPL